jgi:hypothetical protein
MLQVIRFACKKHPLLIPIIFGLLIFAPGYSLAGFFDDLLKKGEELATDAIEEALDEPEAEKQSNAPPEEEQKNVAPSDPPAQPAPTAAAQPTAVAANPPPAAAQPETAGAQQIAKEKPAFGELIQLATSAGQFAAHNDVCGDAIGTAVKADFLTWAERFPEQQESSAISRFDQNYKFKKQQTRPYNCPDTAHRTVLKKEYEYDMRIIGATSMPGGFTPSTRVADVATILAVAKTLPAVSSSGGSNLPDLRAYTGQITAMASDVGQLVVYAELCDDPAAITTRTEYLALVEPLSAEAKDKAISMSTVPIRPPQSTGRSRAPEAAPKCSTSMLESARFRYERTLKLLAEAARTQTENTALLAGISTAKVQPSSVSTANTDGSRIKRIEIEDFYSGYHAARITIAARDDGIVAGCSGTRDPIFRENISTFLRANIAHEVSIAKEKGWAPLTAEHQEKRLQQRLQEYERMYEETVLRVANQGCEKVYVDGKPGSAERAYVHYLAFEAKLLDDTAKTQAAYACLELDMAYNRNEPGATAEAADECRESKYQQYSAAQQH